MTRDPCLGANWRPALHRPPPAPSMSLPSRSLTSTVSQSLIERPTNLCYLSEVAAIVFGLCHFNYGLNITSPEKIICEVNLPFTVCDLTNVVDHFNIPNDLWKVISVLIHAERCSGNRTVRTKAHPSDVVKRRILEGSLFSPSRNFCRLIPGVSSLPVLEMASANLSRVWNRDR